MTTMHAAVLVDVGRIVVRDVPRVDPLPHEVVVRVKAVGMCGTDVHIAAGHANYNFDEHGELRPLAEHPQILGHEIAGLVEEVGGAVTGVSIGDRVIVDQGRTCVSEHRTPICEYCLSGDSHQCEHYREHGITGLPGGFAEYVTVPAANVVPSRSPLSFEQAALAEPLGCIVHSMAMVAASASRYRLNDTRHGRPVRSVLICGGGPAGLLFLQYLRNVTRFDGLVLLSEPNALKRSLAASWGATVLDPSRGDLVPQVRESTKGRGVEFMIEASGAGEIFRAIPSIIRKQATVLVYGHGHTGVELSVMNQVQFREPTIVTPAGASGGHDADGRPLTYSDALHLLEHGVIDVAPIITHRYSALDDVSGALASDYRLPDYVKGVLLQ